MNRLRISVEPRRIGALTAPDHRHDGSRIAAWEEIAVYVKPIVFNRRDLGCEQPRRLVAELLVPGDFRKHQQAIPRVDGFAGRFLIIAVAKAAVAAGPRMPRIDVKAPKVRKERVAAVSAGDIPRQQTNHGEPLLRPGRITAREFRSGAEEIAVVEMVVVEFLVAAEAGGITNQRAPVRFVGEEGRFLFPAIERADGQEVF